MAYNERPRTTAVVITVRTNDIPEQRRYLREAVIDGAYPDAVKELLFELYQKLGEAGGR